MPNSIAFEVWRLTGLVVLALVFGWLFDQVWMMIALVLSAYLVWHIRKINVLYLWIKSKSLDEPPEGSGIWGEVFDEVYSSQQSDQQQKQSLTSTLDRLQQVVSALPDGAVILAAENEIEWCNDAAKRLLGIKLPFDLGHTLTNLVRSPALFEYLTRSDFSEPLEMTSPIDDSLSLSLRVIPFAREQRLLLVRDMTRILRLEQMRKDFIANVSHELRTPLTVVNGYVEVLMDYSDDLKPRMQAMKQQVDRMQNIVNDLLLLSRMETTNALPANMPVGVAALLRDIMHEAEMLSGDKRHQISLEVDESLVVSGSYDELHSAFSNLVSNAVRYTPAGGKISIRWRKIDSHACFDVQDSGIGIAAHDIPRLTERFYRADAARSRETGGTGLGLAIVKHVLSRHDAKLEIESALGVGSCFSCVFPPHRIVRPEVAVTKM